MIIWKGYVTGLPGLFPGLLDESPWHAISNVQHVISECIQLLGSEYVIKTDTAIHKDAKIEEGVILKGPVIISAGCFIGAHAYLRGGVYIGEKTVVGPGCEVKSSLIMSGSALAHFNFVGDSILGSDVNLEAGSIIANHFNERTDKRIRVMVNGILTDTGVEKFGSLVGDHCRIGANAVLSPGTILAPASIVRRLELVDQVG